MIYTIVLLLNLLPIVTFFLGGIAIIYLANKTRSLTYNCAMDALTVRERFLTQQVSFRQDSVKFSLEVERAQLLIKENRLRLVGARQKVLAELDAQLIEEV